jgi:hypothetical protein
MVLLALVVGIAGGAALAAFAGARRTDTAVDRFLVYTRSINGFVGTDPNLFPAIAALPQVDDWNASAYMLMAPVGASGHLDHSDNINTLAIVRAGAERFHLLSGRLPRLDRSDEILINASAANGSGLHVGSQLHLRGWAPADAAAVLRGSDLPPTGPTVDVHVVGVGRLPSELSTSPPTPDVIYTGTGFAFLTPAFFQQYGDQIATAGGVGMGVRLKHGAADFPAFSAAVAKIAPDAQIEPSSDDLTAAVKARHATRLEALALLLFGILAALIAVALVSQSLARQAFVDVTEHPTLGALGMTRRQLIAAAAIRTAMIAGAGAVLAVVFGYVLSPLMPIGLARQAEVHPGISFDPPVLLLGGLAVFVTLSGAAIAVAWRTSQSARFAFGPMAIESERSSRVADRLAHRGVPPTTVVGVRVALEPGHGATAVPVRTTLVSAAVAVTLLVGALTFGAGLTHLANTPMLQGWNWDASVGNPHSDDVSTTAIPLLFDSPDVVAFSGLAGPADAQVGGKRGALFAIDAVKGSVMPPFVEGRGPLTGDEVALATKDLRSLHKHVGQDVSISSGAAPRTMHIVGRMVLTPSVVNDQVNLGQGALVTKEGLLSLGPDIQQNAPENVFLVRFASGVPRAEALQHLRKDFPGTVLTALRPTDVENLRRVDGLPPVLAALFAVVALLTVGHMLVSSVRRRRHDIAILRTIGFVRSQVWSAVAWQATTVVVVGLLVGLPVGIAGGRWAWMVVDSQLGLEPKPVVQLLAVVLVALGALVAANVLASVPGLLAARTRPAEILRAE